MNAPARILRRRPHRVGLAAAFLLTALLVGAPLAAQSSADAPSPADIWTAALEAEARGVWITSNADYIEEDAGVESYGLDWWVLPGGRSAGGCLWGEQGDEQTVYWYFTRIWDPIEQRGFIHQASPQGAIALGYEPQTVGDDLIQTLVGPQGGRLEIRHTTRHEGEDVRHDGSFNRPPGTEEWTPGRTYRWDRRMDVTSPCVNAPGA